MSVLRFGLRSALFAAVIVLLPFTAQAQSGAPLQENEVRRFLATLDPLEELGQRYDESDFDNIEINPDDGFAPMAASLEEFRGHEGYPELQAILADQDFTDEDRWAEVGDRTLRAYMALQIREQHPNMLQEMTAALEQIENQPGVSEEQRASMLEMMGPAVAIARSIEQVSDEDLQMAETMRPEIDAVVDTPDTM